MRPALDFWYEFASTYSYPAAMRIEAEARLRGVEVHWRPFLLGPVFADQGLSDSPFNLYPVKGRYMWRDLERICARMGLAFTRPEPFPQSGLLGARVATALAGASRARFSRALYEAQFARGLKISDRTVIEDALRAAGEIPETVLARADSDETKGALRAETETAGRLGVFGAPTLIAPDGELFWGNDRLEEALEWTRACVGAAAREPAAGT